METPALPIPPTAEQTSQNRAWWNNLSDPWKRAYNEVMVRRSVLDEPEEQTLHDIRHATVLRFAGPTAPYPNMTFELNDLSGVQALENLNLLVVTFHKLTDIQVIGNLKGLTSLFLFNNRIRSLEGIQSLQNLTDLYFNVNQVDSLEPLAHLTKLKTLYCNYNRLTSFEGIGLQHRPNLQTFVSLPNENLPESEVLRMEREIGIRCIKG